MAHPLRANPPLVEIVAEVRWGAGIVGKPASFALDSSADDAKFISFGIAVNKDGYNQLERVVPAGFPSIAGTVVYRYRKSDEDQHTLYQLGAGIFTANGLPPYDSWTKFRPAVANGIDAALSVGSIPREGPVQVTLRYIDAFAGDGLLGRSPHKLMQEMLGFSFQPPSNLKGQPEPSTARLNVEYPCLEGNGIFVIEAGQGKKLEQDALVMTTAVQSTSDSSEAASIMARFDQLQHELHEAFEDLIDRINVEA